MSIYGGFGTRREEETYHKALYNLCFLASYRVLTFLRNETFDDKKFSKYYIKLFQKLYAMDKIKYLQPWFSNAFQDLAMHICMKKDELLEKSTN